MRPRVRERPDAPRGKLAEWARQSLSPQGCCRASENRAPTHGEAPKGQAGVRASGLHSAQKNGSQRCGVAGVT